MQEKRKVSRENSKKLINKAKIKGRVAKDLEFDHQLHGEKFYVTQIAVRRKNGVEDMVPVIFSEGLSKSLSEKITEKMVEIEGDIRTYNNQNKNANRHLKLYLFANKVVFKEDCDDDNNNEIFLQGYLCKTPIYRRTGRSKRKITNLLIAVNRGDGKSSYIPCIAWGENAIRTGIMKIGECIELKGRFQSRTYFKKNSSNQEDGEVKETYEISISDIDLVEE